MSPSSVRTFPTSWRHRDDDDRDLHIADVLTGRHLQLLGATPDVRPLHAALARLRKAWATSKALADWAQLVTDQLEPIPPVDPTPPAPPAPPVQRRWTPGQVLDQGATPHCVGFTGADWIAQEPVVSPSSDQLGHDLYAACKLVDGYPAEDGSDLRALGKVLRSRGRIGAYAFAERIADIETWVLTQGTVMLGTMWTTGMFTPDAQGIVKPTGINEGGHAWSVIGYDAASGMFDAMNHWGSGWGVGGFFRIHRADLDALLTHDGEALVGLELPVIA